MNNTLLLAGKINWKANGTPDEFYFFNVTNPAGSEPAEGSADASITTLDFDQADWGTIAIFENHAGAWDEIRFGSTFADVMGIPEPSTALLLGVGGSLSILLFLVLEPEQLVGSSGYLLAVLGHEGVLGVFGSQRLAELWQIVIVANAALMLIGACNTGFAVCWAPPVAGATRLRITRATTTRTRCDMSPPEDHLLGRAGAYR